MIDYDTLVRRTQIYKDCDLQRDRAYEVARYFNITVDEAIETYRQLNVTKTVRPSANLFANQDMPSVIESYLDPIFLKQSLTRLMLHYNRFKMAWLAASRLEALLPSGFGGLRMVDYGAGAADYALLFSMLGVHPTVVDLVGGPVEFAAFRFAIRGIDHGSVGVTATETYPELPPCDFVNAAEVLEHVDNPCKLIRNIHAALRPHGHFLFSDYPLKPKAVGGAHLRAAADQRAEATDLLRSIFVPVVELPQDYVYIYQKK